MRILIFGDSITYGAWDTEAGWVERLKRDAHKQTVDSKGEKKIQIINLGIGGDTSTKILKRMSSEIEARYSENWPFVFVIGFGTNDERSIEGKVETSIDQFESNVREIIKIMRGFSDRILFFGMPPLGAPIVSLKGQEYSDERIAMYENVLKIVVESEGIKFIPVRPVFEEADSGSLFSYDSLHPNNAGHQLLASTIKPEIDKLLF